MSKLLIKLRYAPDDEIQEIHSLLREHQIDFYETQYGPWGISAPGIWVNDDHQYDRAKGLLDDADHVALGEPVELALPAPSGRSCCARGADHGETHAHVRDLGPAARAWG